MKQAELLTIFNRVRAELAHRYDLPELCAVAVASSTNELAVAFNVTPRGQIASIVNELQVRCTMGKTLHRFGLSVRLDLSYHHVQGGSNGHHTDFIALLDTDLLRADRDNHKYMGLVHDNMVHFIHTRATRGMVPEKAS